MRWSLVLASVVCCFGASTAIAQDLGDPAKLLPKKTLLYFEIQKPGPLAKEIRNLVAKSYISDPPMSLDKLTQKYNDIPYWQIQGYNMLGLVFAEEVAQELQRVNSVSVAFTSFHMHPTDYIPDFLVTIDAGDSNVPRFLTKSLMAMSWMTLEKTDTIGTTKVYRFCDRFGLKGQPGMQKRYSGPAIALMPKGVMIGSHELVKGALRKAHGIDKKGTSLAESKAFGEVRTRLGGQGTLFGYANANALLKLNEIPELRPLDRVLNLTSLKGLAFRAAMRNGTLELTKELALTPGETTPLVGLLSKKTIDPSLLRYVPQSASFVGVISNENGLARWKQAIELANKVMKQIEPEAPPVEQNLRALPLFSTAKAVFLNVDQAALAVGNPLTCKIKRKTVRGSGHYSVTSIPQVPVYVVAKTKDVATAKKLQARIPGLVAKFQVNVPKAKSEMIQGQAVYTAKNNIGQKVSYGRIGQYLILSVDKTAVADAMAASQNGKHALAVRGTLPSIQKLRSAGIFAMVKPVTVFTGAVTLDNHSYYYKGEKKGFKGRKSEDEDEDEDRTYVNTELVPNEFRSLYAEVLKNEAWSYITVTHTKKSLRFTTTVDGLPPVVSGIIDWSIEAQLKSYQNRPKGDKGFKEVKKG
ncbi:MAG: hypothetical protein ACFCD0_13305 [Gemmataceae bacterium]